MNTRRARLAVTVLLAFGVAGTQGSAAEKPRASADGVEFPAAGERRVKITLPVIGDKLGCLPEEMGAKVYRVDRSVDLLNKHKVGLDCEWFVVGLSGADIAGFDLTDGRVSRIVLLYKPPRPSMPAAVDAGMARLTKAPRVLGDEAYVYQVRNTAKDELIPVFGGATPEAARFGVPAIDLYLMTHEVPTDIATAMRERRPAKGMIEEQVLLILGKPTSKDESADSKELTWKFYEQGRGTAVSLGGQVLIPGEAGALKRRVTVTLTGGKVVDYTDHKN